jgi:hypothetical protein
MLDQKQFLGKWTEIKSGLRNLWGEISDEELELVKDNLLSISQIVEDKYGEEKASILKKIQSLMDTFDNETDKSLKLNDGESSYRRSPVIPEVEDDNTIRH